MPYRIAGIDVHKKNLAVVVADVEVAKALLTTSSQGEENSGMVLLATSEAADRSGV
jgi:hypothetical protein